jgi:hypothetical protein
MKIFAIELTNWCNAKCSFCPYPTPAHTRSKGYMDWKTLYRICDIATEPKAINLSGLGEPTLHPKLVNFVKELKFYGFKVQMNTNGQKLNQDLYDQLHAAGLDRIVITADYFKWNKGSINVQPDLPVQLLTITRAPDHPELGQVQKPLDDWGGQVGKVDRPTVRCSFLHDNFYQICWDGTVQRCCVDFNANHAVGNIHNDVDVIRLRDQGAGKGIPLCEGCHGYVFKDGIVAGDFEGTGEVFPDAFVPLGLLPGSI